MTDKFLLVNFSNVSNLNAIKLALSKNKNYQQQFKSFTLFLSCRGVRSL